MGDEVGGYYDGADCFGIGLVVVVVLGIIDFVVSLMVAACLSKWFGWQPHFGGIMVAVPFVGLVAFIVLGALHDHKTTTDETLPNA